jgi:hypothetical protein
MSKILGGGGQEKQMKASQELANQQMALQKQQLGLQTEQSNLAREQFQLQTAEQERLRLQTEEEKRTLQEEMAAKKQARTRGGQRLLLSEARLNPEMGLDEESLGA